MKTTLIESLWTKIICYSEDAEHNMFYIFLSLELYRLRVGRCWHLRGSSAQYKCLSSETTRENSKVQGFTEGNKNLNTTILCFCVKKNLQSQLAKFWITIYLKMWLGIVLCFLWCIIESEHPFPIPHDLIIGIDPKQSKEWSELLFVGAGLCNGVVPLPAIREHAPCISHRELPRQSGGVGRTY